MGAVDDVPGPALDTQAKHFTHSYKRTERCYPVEVVRIILRRALLGGEDTAASAGRRSGKLPLGDVRLYRPS
jgi:hypothetical protein